jgi:hypothetical protein
VRGQPAITARAARGQREGSQASARGEPAVEATGASGQCEGSQSFARAPLDVVDRSATRRCDTRQCLLHGPPLVSAGTISARREGRHYSVQGVPPVIASPATLQCGTRQFVDPRVLLQQNDLFRHRAALALIGGSPRTDSVLPFTESVVVSHVLRCCSSRDTVRVLPSADAPLARMASSH